MNLAALWAEIEGDQAWREKEIRFLQNRSDGLQSEQEKDQFRRALVLFLYAHFEGFCHFALAHYVKAVNAENIKCGDANHALAAASLWEVFRSLRNPDAKCDVFRNALPDDQTLHRFARDREFIERSEQIHGMAVRIPESVVDTESNLKPVVLRKNLYRLGLPHDLFREIEGSVHRLLSIRNRIAHGETPLGVTLTQYIEMKDVVYEIMNEVKRAIMRALQEKQYLRTSTADTARN